MAGYFRINGATVTSRDPMVYGMAPQTYGYQGSGREIVGPYRAYQFEWASMPDSDFAALVNKIEQLNGARASVTVPVGYSTSWETRQANLTLTSWGRSYAGHVQGVVLEARRVT